MSVYANLNGIKISAIATAVPTHKDNIQDYRDKIGDKTVDRFIKNTGVSQVRISVDKQTASDLAYVAAKNLMDKECVSAEEINAIIFVTQTPDYHAPSTALVLQKRLGIGKNCVAFDINLGCSGYVYGINVAASIMKTNNIKKCLLLVGDTSTKVSHPGNESDVMLFGDSGSATLLTQDNSSEMCGSFCSDGNRFTALIQPKGAYRNICFDKDAYSAYMNGTEVFTFSITEVPKQINEFLGAQNKATDDYDVFAMHQANCYMLKQIAKRSKIPSEKMPISMDRYGNTSVGSIPLTLCDAYGEKNGEINAFMCGFGIGLSWGIVTTVIDAAHIYPIIETDDYYTEGDISFD